MKIIRQYPQACVYCSATGVASQPSDSTTTATTRICPVCGGSGTITVTETIEDDWIEQIGEIIPHSII